MEMTVDLKLNEKEATALQDMAAKQGRAVEDLAAELLAAALVRVQVVTGE